MYTWAALKDNVKWAKILWTNTEPCSNREFQQEEQKNFHSLKIFVFLESHAKTCVERYCELANKTTQQLYKVSTLASMTTTSKKKWNPLENCHKYAPKFFWNACTWQELEGLIFYGQWTNLHDQSSNGPKHVTNAWIDWIHIFIIHGNTNNIAMWVILLNNADWDCFETLTLREMLRIQNPHLEEHCAFLEVTHLFQQVGCARNKLPAVSHSSTESEIISFDAGLRLDGLPALESWDLIVSVFGSVTQTSDRTGRLVDTERSQKAQGKINVFKNISRQEALLCIFEDNEAVIKMIIKWRSPTMRHVSRTHRIALDWLFDRINLDPKIQIKYIDTKNPLADILTKGNFTRDEWNHLLCLFNINHFSSTVCSAAMAKRSQQNCDLWWILLPGRRRSYRPRLQWARWRDITENKIHIFYC